MLPPPPRSSSTGSASLLAPSLSALYLLILLPRCQLKSMLVIEGSNLPVELHLVNRIVLIGRSGSNSREHDRAVITVAFRARSSDYGYRKHHYRWDKMSDQGINYQNNDRSPKKLGWWKLNVIKLRFVPQYKQHLRDVLFKLPVEERCWIRWQHTLLALVGE